MDAPLGRTEASIFSCRGTFITSRLIGRSSRHEWQPTLFVEQLLALMNLAAGFVMAAEYSLPARIRVLPVAFVWHSKLLVDGKAMLYLNFPVAVRLSGMAIHSQHSGIDHEARAMRLETNDPDSRQPVVENPLKSFDETMTFPAAIATRWTLTLTARPSRTLVLRGLRFFDGDEEVCPHMVPYQESPAVARAPF